MQLRNFFASAWVSMVTLPFLSAGSALAQGNQAGSADQQFVQKAYSINQAEITLGQMAEQKGVAADVKAFGARMVADHTKALDELKTAAQRDGVTWPKAILPPQQQLKDQLAQLNGSAFDDAYMKHMVEGHGAAISVFTQEIANGSGAALRAYAEQSLPMLESHEAAADQDADQLRNQPAPGR